MGSGFDPGIFDEAAMSEGANRFKNWIEEKVGKATQLTNPRQISVGMPAEADALSPQEPATATIDPLVAANKIAQAPVKMGEAAGKIGTIGGEGIVQALHPSEMPEETRQKHPIQTGAASGAGEFAGELVGNPTNWPFLMEGAIARPLLKRAVSTAFAGQMVKGTAEGAQQLAQQWDSIDPHERAKQVTKLGLGGAFAEEGARHAVHANVAAAHGLDITPNMHPDTAPKMVEGTLKNGGSTIDPWTGKDHFGTNKTAVSFTSGLKVEIPVDQFKDQGESLIHAYANQPQIARILREPNTVLGTSMNPKTGNVELEPTYLSKSENAALKYGSPQFWNQREVFHLGRAETMPTGGTGAPEQTSPVDPVERVRLMNSEQPQPTRGVYRHHSDILIKPDENGISTLTGTTRFASRIGQERGRSGEPGIYAYDMNTPAEAGIRERQHEYRMIKDAAIADANDPKYAEIAQTQGGHAVEKAIKADGYDGYTNSQVPGSYFFFGDADARHVSKGPPPTPEEIAAQRGSFTVDPSKRLGAGQLNAPRPAQEIQLGEASAVSDPMSIIEQAGLIGRSLVSDDPNSPIMIERPDLLGQGKQVTMRASEITSPEAVKSALDAKLEQYGTTPIETPKLPGRGLQEDIDRMSAGFQERNAQAQSDLETATEKARKHGEILKALNAVPDITKVKLVTKMPEIERKALMSSLNLDPTDFLMPEEKARMGKRAIEQLKKEFAALPPMEEAVAATQAGMSGADWWRRGRELYPTLSSVDDHYFPVDPAEQKKFANVMGATSPHQAVETAELEALHVWNQYRSKIVDAGKPVTEANIRKYVKLLSLPGAKQAAVTASLMGQDVFGVGRTDRGLKRAAMGQALGGGPEGSEPGEAYVGDTHMADLKGMEPAARVFSSAAAYYAMAAQDRAVARQLNMDLSDVQAAQWSTKMAIQEIMGEMPDAPAETILGRVDAATINKYKKDLIDLMRTDPQIQRYMVEEYGFDPEKLKKLNVKLSALPKETLGQSVPASSLTPQLKAGVERLRTKYGKPVAPQGPLFGGPLEGVGDTSFEFGANAPKVISEAARSAKGRK